MSDSATQEQGKQNHNLNLCDEVKQFYDDPLAYCLWAWDWGEGELKGMSLDYWQQQLLFDLGEEITKRNFDGVFPVDALRFSTSSGHGVGKSAVVAMLVNFLMSTRPFCKGVVTASTASQLETKTWAEVCKWNRRSKTGHWFDTTNSKTSMKIYNKEHPDSWRCDGITCKEENSESFAGLHAANSTPFYIFDESAGVPDKIFEVAEGGLTDGEPWLLMFGNMTKTSGGFYTSQHGMKHRYNVRQIDAREARMPNKSQIEEWIEDYGMDSNFVRVRVLGLPPKAGDMQFIGADMVIAAQKRAAASQPSDPLILGVDVAWGGSDDSILYPRKGYDFRTMRYRRLRTADTTQLVAAIAEFHNEVGFDMIFIDETGGGIGVFHQCRALGLPVTGINFGAGAPVDGNSEVKCANMRSFMYSNLKKILPYAAIPDEFEIEQQLTAAEYDQNKQGALILEPKELIRKRIGGSPDIADAMALTVATPVFKSASTGGRDARGKLHQSDYDPWNNEAVDYDPHNVIYH